jgi:hypothetical protein
MCVLAWKFDRLSAWKKKHLEQSWGLYAQPVIQRERGERKYLAATVKVREREEGEGREFKPEPPVILGSMVCQRDEQELNDSHLSALI